MAGPVDKGLPDDGVLVAFIDGELDADERRIVEKRLAADSALRARLDMLDRGGRPFAEAFEPLLAAAPHEQLDAIYAAATESLPKPGVVKTNTPGRRWGLAAIAAALAIFVVGAAAGFLVPLLTGLVAPVQVAESPNWRQVVAEYSTLTTAETLAAIPVDAGLLSTEVKTLGTRVSLQLSADKLMLPDVMLKRAQAFEFRGRPLVQFAYLSPVDGPLAFCIIANGRPDAAPAFEQREGSNIVFWTKDGRGYMIIGKAPRETLEAFAGSLAGTVS
jgi:anti-sigma factor RsiW